MKMMFAGFFGGWEIVLILAVVLILFGAKKLPELAKGLGQGIKEFKKATREVSDELNNAMQDSPAQTTYQPPKSIAQTPEQPSPAPATPQNTQAKG
jgi:sec-independent protein translocase protein TatA